MGKVGILQDLIEINNDRVAGFDKANEDIKDENIDLKQVFSKYADQSRRFAQELSAEVGRLGEEVDTDKSVAGTLHRAWIDIKSVFSGGDRKSILDEAERGEDAIKAAYKKALEDVEITGELRQVLTAQAQEVNEGHDTIKALRDLSK
ncbi:PA2169 family four-helix-bundle protein [Sphingobacterium sp. lm-10]|uniref:ferritin-like domain-containing protein n=1 Tax=Sphingobacterium sp. lm-10 TaxID=2944904 RepID=UPI002021EF42|nr:PA2169 family four-helix-bundle protein [Sphingobacterium sp. lm-10]MCL7986941.1 PA2169 family four-helix-bundle protein [Sphingobacterium sp. lm-10]